VNRIAVVEDNPDNRLLLRAFLQEAYDLSEYETGVEALEGFEIHKPDLILLDISLPEMDGLQLLARLKANPRLRDIPVIALTAHAMTDDRARFLQQGFDEYIAKPIVDDRHLLDVIERLLNAVD
jgi:CheY-like chemotaxis protein